MSLRKRAYVVESKDIHVEVKELPHKLQVALKKVGYGKRDVRVVPTSSASVRSSAGKGRRGFAMAVNLQTGQMSDVAKGSWGGQNPFEKRSVDWEDKPVKIPPNGAIIVGKEGYKGAFATIYIHPDNMAPLLPGEGDLTDRARDILAMSTYKSAYKKEMYARHKVKPEELDALVKGGYLKRNKAGAISVTAKGKNAKSKRFF